MISSSDQNQPAIQSMTRHCTGTSQRSQTETLISLAISFKQIII